MENWTEIKITVPVERVDEAGAIASMTVPYGIYIEDYSDLEEQAMAIAKIDLIDEDLLAKDRTKGIVHIYISPEENPQEAVSFISDRLRAEGIDFVIDLGNCAREDWENNWKQYFKPIKVGKKLLIRPAWIDDYDPEGRTVLNLEPGVAFGTGTHETTRLCMEALEEHVRPGMNMLDVGCGSGILSVAGMLLGAKNATGVDIDRLAVKVAVENGKLNGLSEPAFHMLHGNLTDRISGKFQIVTANIVADAIIMLTPSVIPFLDDDAVYIVSGIIDTREDEVTACLAENGFEILKRLTESGWVCMVCQRKKS
jgi:ribosomal protein L11 methyltransferase